MVDVALNSRVSDLRATMQYRLQNHVLHPNICPNVKMCKKQKKVFKQDRLTSTEEGKPGFWGDSLNLSMENLLICQNINWCISLVGKRPQTFHGECVLLTDSARFGHSGSLLVGSSHFSDPVFNSENSKIHSLVDLVFQKLLHNHKNSETTVIF